MVSYVDILDILGDIVILDRVIFWDIFGYIGICWIYVDIGGYLGYIVYIVISFDINLISGDTLDIGDMWDTLGYIWDIDIYWDIGGYRGMHWDTCGMNCLYIVDIWIHWDTC